MDAQTRDQRIALERSGMNSRFNGLESDEGGSREGTFGATRLSWRRRNEAGQHVGQAEAYLVVVNPHSRPDLAGEAV